MTSNSRLLAELKPFNKYPKNPDKAALQVLASGRRRRSKPVFFVAQPTNDGAVKTRSRKQQRQRPRYNEEENASNDESSEDNRMNRVIDVAHRCNKRKRTGTTRNEVLCALKNRSIDQLKAYYQERNKYNSSLCNGKQKQSDPKDRIHRKEKTQPSQDCETNDDPECHEIKRVVKITHSSNVKQIRRSLRESESRYYNDGSDTINTADNINNDDDDVIKKGYKIRKAFTFWYDGVVVSNKPEWRYCHEENQNLKMWKVRFHDNDEEELTRQQLEEYHANLLSTRKTRFRVDTVAEPVYSNLSCASKTRDMDSYNKAFADLCNRVGFTQDEVRWALAEVGLPYCLNASVERIMERKDSTAMERFKNSQRRELRMLEFFAGKAVVSEALHNYGSYWRTRSIDKDPNSRATDKIDFMKVRWKNIGKLPDFIWITLPCFTHSFLARGDNRSTKENWFAKAPEALWQDRFLARMSWFLEWVKKKNDHVIFVIENPTGWMGEMAMIKTIVGKMEMRRTTVDYCVSGGSDKVSTNLWTNDSKLHAALSMFSKSSPESCSHHGRPYPHHPRYKPAEISRDLAETVAESVSARFGVNDLKVCYKAEPEVSTEEITFFNKMMGGAD